MDTTSGRFSSTVREKQMKSLPTLDIDAQLDELRGLVRLGKLFDVQKWIAQITECDRAWLDRYK